MLRLLEPLIARLILQGRLNARQAAHDRLIAELRQVAAANPDFTAAPVRVAGIEVADMRRASRVAASFAQHWADSAAKAAAAGVARARVAAEASKAQASRVDMVAATEAVNAFCGERDEELIDWSEREPAYRRPRPQRPEQLGFRQQLIPVRRWDSMLDKRVCPTCESLEGKIAPIGDDFGGYEPGSVHPRCRCYDAIEMLPAYLAWDETYDDVAA